MLDSTSFILILSTQFFVFIVLVLLGVDLSKVNIALKQRQEEWHREVSILREENKKMSTILCNEKEEHFATHHKYMLLVQDLGAAREELIELKQQKENIIKVMDKSIQTNSISRMEWEPSLYRIKKNERATQREPGVAYLD